MSIALVAGSTRQPVTAPVRAAASGRHGSGWLLRFGTPDHVARHARAPRAFALPVLFRRRRAA